jgi:signal peptidase I
MLPTLFIGDSIAVQWTRERCQLYVPTILCRIFAKDPQRGDIVVFNVSRDRSDNYVVKRIIGLPGDTIEVMNGLVLINSSAVQKVPSADFVYERGDGKRLLIAQFIEKAGDISYSTLYGYRPEPPLPSPDLENMPPVVVPPDRFFVLGDDRDRSFDSRMRKEDGGTGTVDAKSIAGVAALVLCSFEPLAAQASRSLLQRARFQRFLLSAAPDRAVRDWNKDRHRN